MRGPHEHLCPECQCTWSCSNEEHCLDLPGKWCGNVCGDCQQSPRYLERLNTIQDAREHLRYAAHLLTTADEPDLAESVRYVATQTQTRAEERSKGIPGGKQ